MLKPFIPILCGSALALGACATNPYGYGGYGGTGGPYESPGYYGAQGLQQAAVNACGATAARYGQVSIRNVRAVSRSTMRVYGLVGSRYGGRNFACSFRSDGRITDFDI